MLKKSLLILSLSTLIASANDAKQVALDLCEYSKTANVEGMIKHASKAMLPQLNQIAEMLKMAKSTPQGRAKLAEGLKNVASVNCKTSTKLTKNSDGSFKVTNNQTKQQFTLKKVNQDWKFAP